MDTICSALGLRAASREGLLVRVTLTKRGRVWHCYYRLNGKRFRQSLGVENRKIAEDLRRELEWKLNSPAQAGAAPVRISTFRSEYESHSKATKRPKSHATDWARLECFLDSLTVEHLHEVRAGDASRFLSERALAGISPATVLRYREVILAFFNHAVRLGYLEQNPVARVPRPRLQQRDPRFLSLDQIDELLKTLDGHSLQPLVATLIFAGLRRAEVCWLTRDDVRLKEEPSVIRVRAKTIRGESWLPKTRRDRAVPISPRLRSYLEKVSRRGVWFFPSPQGCRWDGDNLSAQFRALMKTAGLPWNFLDLRHTFGSQLARKGVSLLKIAKLMGNSPEIARRHYINLMPEELGEDVEF